MTGKARCGILAGATAVALVTVNALHVPPVVAALRGLLGRTPLLDMRPLGYGAGDVAALLAALGPRGRALYLELLWTVDLVLPALFSAFLFTALGLGRFRRWRAAGLLGGAADYLENAALTALLLGPGAAPGLVRAASALTTAKWILYLGAAALAAAGATTRRGRSSRCAPDGRAPRGGAPARSPAPPTTRTVGARSAPAARGRPSAPAR